MSRVTLLVFVLFVGFVSIASAEAPAPYARVLVDTAPVRTGPGTSYQRIYRAERGEVFPIRRRGSRDYWFQIELPDGTTGWILGDAVHVQELSEEEAQKGRFLPQIFAPPPLPSARAELAITAGLLGRGGILAVRPTILLAPEFGFEVTAAASASSGGRLFLGGLGGIVNLFPRWPIVPFAIVGGGIAHSSPNADTFVLESGSLPMMYAGGGLRFGFRYRLVLRIEARAYAFIEPDRYVAQEEYSGGLTVFF